MHRAQEPTVDRPMPGPRPSRRHVDLARLEADLRRSVRGEVQFDAAARAMYATDASNFRQMPIAVVRPVDADDVVAAIDTCRRHDAPVLARGGGTSLAGQCCNVAVVLDFNKHMNRILEIDPVKRVARVQPGVILDQLREAAEAHGLTLGPDPATHDHCTIGGMIGNNACGVHAQMAGRMADNVHELEVVTYRGHRMRVGAYEPEEIERAVEAGGPRAEIFRALVELRDRNAEEIRARYPDIPRRVSGYNLDELLPERGFHVARSLVGSEGTCVTITEATVRLVPSPNERVLLVLGFDDVFVAADHVTEVVDAGPIGLEGLDQQLIEDMRARHLHTRYLESLPGGNAWLMVEFGGDTRREAADKARALLARLEPTGILTDHVLYLDDAEQQEVWEVRESGLGATARVPGKGDAWPGWEDSAVPPERLGDYLRDLKALFRQFGYQASTYGHFGQGCVHCRIDFDLRSKQGIATYRRFVEEAARLCVSYGGSLSGEHGDGQQRGEILPIMFGHDLVDAMVVFKRIWDPDRAMNPGKVVDADRLDENLRLGADYDPLEPKTRFQYPDDDGRFSRATLRCVGVGKCRRESGGTMCPSYKVTREEMHSTRGRAHLLWEMLQPDSAIEDGFGSEKVREALDLCLSCKGCKSDCPMNVDMATYKAEFLSHHYAGRMRPRSAYALGLIWWWARIASFAPWLANLVTQTPGLSRIAKAVADVHPKRPLPAFAGETFRSWYRKRPRRNDGEDRVLLWADTWTNHFRPEVGKAAVEVLEAAGYDVIVLQRELCCGRPLYDFGMLERAERLLEQVMEATRPFVELKVPVVVLEPSCASTFRDELVERFPDRREARELHDDTYTLGEFLERFAPSFRPRLDSEVLVHGHCHQKAVMSMKPEHRVLEQMGADVTLLDTGCCGMAGSFGFETHKYDVSVAAGEQDLLPKVRRADERALIVSDGFSCRTQIEDLTDRRGVHLAQVVQLALRKQEGRGDVPQPPEASWNRPEDEPGRGVLAGFGPALAVGGLLAVGLLLFRRQE